MLDEPSIGLHTRDTARLIHILERAARPGQHDPRRRARRRHFARRRSFARSGTGCGRVRRQAAGRGRAGRDRGQSSIADGPLSCGKISIPVPTRRRAPGREKLVLHGARANNLHGLDVEIPLGHAGRGDGSFRLGQIDARAPGAVSRGGAGAGAERMAADPSGRFRFFDRRRAPKRRGAGGPDAHRAHAALESHHVHQGLRPGARAVCRAARGQAALAHAGTFFVQRARRALQHMRRRRHGDGGDAVSGRCGAALRGLQRHPLPGQEFSMCSTRARTFTMCCR